MNLKPINEVPEIESLQEGDKILVNSNGLAKQIAASKVGGRGGGMGTIYGTVQMLDETISSAMLVAYADKEMTKPMTYAEGLTMLESGMRLYAYAEQFGGWVQIIPMLAAGQPDQMMLMAQMGDGGIAIVFSDTPGLSGEEG